MFLTSCFHFVVALVNLKFWWAFRKGPCVCVGTTCQCSRKLLIIINGNTDNARAGHRNITLTSAYTVRRKKNIKHGCPWTRSCVLVIFHLITCQSANSRCWRWPVNQLCTQMWAWWIKEREACPFKGAWFNNVSWCVTPVGGELGERSEQRCPLAGWCSSFPPGKDASLGSRRANGISGRVVEPGDMTS